MWAKIKAVGGRGGGRGGFRELILRFYFILELELLSFSIHFTVLRNIHYLRSYCGERQTGYHVN